MTRPKQYFGKRRGSSSGRKVYPFKAGPFMTVSADPQHCYIVGGILSTGQVVETLSLEMWAKGTRFKTEVGGKTVEYEVDGRVMRLVNPQGV